MMMSRVEVFFAALILWLAADRVCAQVCNDNDIRLVGGANPLEGRVELCYRGQWGTVCDDSFGPTDASVVCRQIGFTPENATIAKFGPGSGSIVLDDVRCVGDEVQLTNCSHRGLGENNCDHNEDIGVTCQDGFIYTLDKMEYTATETDGTVRVCVVCTSPVSEQLSTPTPTITVMFSTADGTAVDGIDYIGIRRPIVCQYDQPPLCMNISILSDLIDEPAEFFQVIIGGNQTMQLDGARVVITDSETPGVGFEKRAYIVPENAGEVRVCITTNVTLNENPVFGSVTTEDITATAGFDYQYLGLVLTFPTGGNDTLCVTITIIDDDITEPAESFLVRFTQAGSNIPVFAPTTTVVILDQDQDIFYPFGTDGDEYVERGDDNNSTEIHLPQPFPFRSLREDTLFVNTNGLLSFRESVPYAGQAISVPVIAPFRDDVDTTSIGNVSYQITTDPLLLERVYVSLQNHFERFFPKYLVIATWKDVPAWGRTLQQRNTFQAVMATDGVMSFVFFIYFDLQWRGSFTTIGFCGLTSCSCTVSNRIFPVTMSGCATGNSILNLRSGSNVDTPGVYVYRVDGEQILRPVGGPSQNNTSPLHGMDGHQHSFNGPAALLQSVSQSSTLFSSCTGYHTHGLCLCSQNYDTCAFLGQWNCIDGEVQLANLASGGVVVHICSNGLLERVCGEGWNNRHAAVVCRQLGFSVDGAVAITHELMGESPPIVSVSACNGREINLFACNETITPTSNSGSGSLDSSGAVEEQPTGSCLHFAGVHCSATTVGLEQPAYTVGEGSVLVVCVQRNSSGIYPLIVSMRTVDVSAQAGNDYIGVSMSLQFLPSNHRICTEVNITSDNETEPTESFLIFLTSTDTTVLMDLQFAYIYIIAPTVLDLDPVTSSAVAPTTTLDLNPALYTLETATPAITITPDPGIPSPQPDDSTSVTIIAGVLFAVVVCCLFGGIGLLLILYCRRRRKTFEITGVSNANTVNDCDVQLHHKDLPEDLVIPSSTIRLLSSVGEGEFGIVYKAHWVRSMQCATGYAMPDVVAAKTMKGFFTQDQTEEMIKEGLKMKHFDHPNVIGIIGFCIDAGPAPYIIMPFMANGSLLSYLKRERSNLVVTTDSEFVQTVQKKLMDMCLQIAMGMEYLARQRIVHRDLAARNCMIDIHFVLKVSDFGLSESVYTNAYFRQEKNPTVRLPLKWMSPESMTDGLFSEKTDVWSYGITCWEVFTGGKLPYPGVDPHSLPYLLEDGHRLGKPNNAACSDDMYLFMDNCWHKDPEMRPTFTVLASTISEQLQSTAGYLAISDFRELPEQYNGADNKNVGAVKVTAL